MLETFVWDVNDSCSIELKSCFRNDGKNITTAITLPPELFSNRIGCCFVLTGIAVSVHARDAAQQRHAVGRWGRDVFRHQLASQYAGIYHRGTHLPHHAGTVRHLQSSVQQIYHMLCTMNPVSAPCVGSWVRRRSDMPNRRGKGVPMVELKQKRKSVWSWETWKEVVFLLQSMQHKVRIDSTTCVNVNTALLDLICIIHASEHIHTFRTEAGIQGVTEVSSNVKKCVLSYVMRGLAKKN